MSPAAIGGLNGGGVTRRLLLGGWAMLAVGLAGQHRGWTMGTDSGSGYATIDGLRVYYEWHGGTPDGGRLLPREAGEGDRAAVEGARVPIVLLHGGALTIETAFPPDLIPRFARARPVIAIEEQGHGHTGDRPGPMTIDRMVADTAGVLAHLGVPQADVFGHSLGGIIATGLAIRHSSVVRSLTTLAAPYQLEGFLTELVRIQRDPTLTPASSLVPLLPTEADFAVWRASFKRSAPEPTAYDAILVKLNTMLATWPGWTEAELRGIGAPALIAIGDNDYVRIEHAGEMARLIPDARLAVLPGTTHFGIVKRGAWLEPMMAARLQPAL
jgi:pimeloyl-ACP methyl ester carboxylesterase